MRYLGIDYGTKRVGVAIADAQTGIAFPRAVFPNTERLVSDLVELVRSEVIEEVVLGESRDFSGKENSLMRQIHAFKKQLAEETGVPVVLFPEVLSSREAMRLQGDNEMNDASAAAIVLQSYLERIHARKGAGDATE
jgi:putative Holliday junction resolvase